MLFPDRRSLKALNERARSTLEPEATREGPSDLERWMSAGLEARGVEMWYSVLGRAGGSTQPAAMVASTAGDSVWNDSGPTCFTCLGTIRRDAFGPRDDNKRRT